MFIVGRLDNAENCLETLFFWTPVNKSNKTNKEKVGQDKKRHDEIIRQDEIRQDKT